MNGKKHPRMRKVYTRADETVMRRRALAVLVPSFITANMDPDNIIVNVRILRKRRS